MENNVDTSQVVRRPKKSNNFLGILNRRSTKIEPKQNMSSDESLLNSGEELGDTRQSSPKQGIFNKKQLERNNTCPALNLDPMTTSSNANYLSPRSPKEIENNNRYSFCCATDSEKQLLAANGATSEISNNNNLTVDTEISPNEKRTPSPSPTLAHQSSTRPLEIKSTSNYVLPPYSSYPSPIFRSRFREKFLPPDANLDQHNSSPNIATQSPSPVSRQHSRKSGSFDTIAYNEQNQNEQKENGENGEKEDNAVDSTNSLARQALMAAHVLHLIPTDKARQRNFLQGRLAPNSLLGNAELEKVLPNRELMIFVGSWNMNGESPPKQMNDFVLPNGIEHLPDLIVFGTQESCSERFEWEVTLQETLGPSHVLLHSASLGTLLLAAFIRRDLIWYCSEPEDASLSVRPGTAFRTKGAVAISFCLFGTSMLFVTAHLTAHQQKVKERVQDIKRIIHALDLPRNLTLRHRNKDVTQNFDSVYFCGDLNFRLSEPRANLLKWIETTSFPLPDHLPNGYLHTDQLTSVLADGAAFKGFKEAKINFPPTYKYDVGTQHFDTSSKQRAPAYTDRILYKYKLPPLGFRRVSNAALANEDQVPIKCLAYDSVQSITSSDHKPVWALFRNAIRPGIDSIPLAAGLFNREVYLEGMKRRLDSSYTEAPAVCSIQ